MATNVVSGHSCFILTDAATDMSVGTLLPSGVSGVLMFGIGVRHFP